jgi:hypothetical protein
MEKSYQILRINKDSVTVLLQAGAQVLQQDVPVDDFDNTDQIQKDITEYVYKLEAEVEVMATEKPVTSKLSALVGQTVTVANR